MGHVATFLGVSLIVIVTPGPDTALTIRNTLFGGRSGGVATAGGVASGQATWALFTAAGVAGLLRVSQPAFVALRIAGASYLVFLGLQGLLAARRARAAHVARRDGTRPSVRAAVAYRQGLISNLSNPKMVVFFVSLLPQFSGPHASFATVLMLGIAFCVMTLCWLSAYALVVAKAGDFLRRGKLRRLLDAVTGAVLIALGLRLVTETS